MTRTIILCSVIGLALALSPVPASAQAIWDFYANPDGWRDGNPTNSPTTVGHLNGALTAVVADNPGTFDPILISQTLNLNADKYTEFAMQITVSGVPSGGTEPFAAALFWFKPDFGRARFNLSSGTQVVRFSIPTTADAEFQAWSGTVQYIRLDLPNDLDHSWVGLTAVIDWIAVTDDPDFTVVDNPTQWERYKAYQSSTAPVIDGTISPGEYRTDPLVMSVATMNALGGSSVNGMPDTGLVGTFYLTWDSTWLYCAAHVKDSEVVYLVDQGNALNATDGIQLCTDHQFLDDGAAMNTPGICIHDVVPGQPSDHNKAAYWQHWPDPGGYPATFPNTQFAGRTIAGEGYEVEMAIKWSDFDPNPPTPAVGFMMKYLLLIMDFTGTALTDLWWNAGYGVNIIVNAYGYDVLELAGDWGLADSDGDGLTNGAEETLGTDPYKADTDGDGLSDSQETNVYNTDPLDPDTDGDGASDGLEVAYGYDPLDAGDVPPLPTTTNYGLVALLGLLALAGGTAGAWTLRRARSH